MIYEQKKITDVPLAMASKNPQRSAGTSAGDNISQNNSDVKEKFSRQVINSTWDDIKDKMYENEIHEDVIGEIEGYINKIKRRNISRETAITEGAIPKYEAILKVSREFTRETGTKPIYGNKNKRYSLSLKVSESSQTRNI